MPRDEQYLVEIVEAAGTIDRWLDGVDVEYFAIEWHRVWSIARRSAPAFAGQVLNVLRIEFPDVADHLEQRR